MLRIRDTQMQTLRELAQKPLRKKVQLQLEKEQPQACSRMGADLRVFVSETISVAETHEIKFEEDIFKLASVLMERQFTYDNPKNRELLDDILSDNDHGFLIKIEKIEVSLAKSSEAKA